VFGPESTGKTTLSRQLAAHFGGTWVPEYARCYLEHQQGKICPQDMISIAKGQSILEQVTEYDAKPLLFCDTDPRVTNIWNQYLFQRMENDIPCIANQHHYDLTLLLDVDVPFEEDVIRYLPSQRQPFFESCREMLAQANSDHVIIRGDWQERLEVAIRAIENYFVKMS